MQKLSYLNVLFIIVFFTIILSLFLPAWETIGLSMFSLVLINFFYFSHTSFDIRHLIILIAVTQWVFGSVLSYNFVPDNDVYKMKVPAEQYFSFVIPGVLSYSFGLFFPIKYPKINKPILIENLNKIRKNNKSLEIILIAAGLFFSIFNKFVPASLRFITFLLSGVQYVGLIMILTNPYRKNKKTILIFAGVFLLVSGIIHGGFGLIFTWLIASYIIYSFFVKVPLRQKILLASLAILFSFIMQGVKVQYRDAVWFGGNNLSIIEKLELFTILVGEKEKVNDDETEKSMISRINQGWIISEIIFNMETQKEEYLEGETIYRALLSSVLPGSLYEDKLMAGGQEYFTRFTGRKIGKTTSMNLSVLGEAYGNYGRTGAVFFMFLFGLFLNISFKLVVKTILKRPLIVFFIPMIFQQVIKAEGDFFIVLNHLIKSSIFITIIYIALSQIFKLKNNGKL